MRKATGSRPPRRAGPLRAYLRRRHLYRGHEELSDEELSGARSIGVGATVSAVIPATVAGTCHRAWPSCITRGVDGPLPRVVIVTAWLA